MGSMRKIVSSNLGGKTDEDIIKYVEDMEKIGINNSKLIKQCIRFYISYHPSTSVQELKPKTRRILNVKHAQPKTPIPEFKPPNRFPQPVIKVNNSVVARTMAQLSNE